MNCSGFSYELIERNSKKRVKTDISLLKILILSKFCTDTIYKCSACPFTCANVYYMERHRKTCRELEGNAKTIFQCSHCAYTCANTYFLERHKKHCFSQLAGRPQVVFNCSGCSYTCANTYYLERHRKFCRGEAKDSNNVTIKKENDDDEFDSFACSQCNEVFYDEETLASHQLTHAGENPLICKVCNERFFDLDTLTSHVQAHYGEERAQEQCELDKDNGHGGEGRGGRREGGGGRWGEKGGGGSSTGGYTKRHLHKEIKEEEEERFPCPLCGIQFFLKDSLTVHLRIHRGEKPFLCLECDVGFSREDYLRRHSRMHHEGKRFVCAECGKKYSELVYLKQHQRIHKTGPEV